jgi:thiamine-phosphate pyrophosphorylase
MNDRPDLALLSDADGVHVGQEELSVHEARRIVGPQRLVGVSTHNIEQARQAVIDGADYIGVGPVFASKTKDFSSLAGLEFVRQVAGEIKLPWFAIGGIDEDNIERLIAAGATHVAVSSAICGSQQPGDVTANLRARLEPSNSDAS